MLLSAKMKATLRTSCVLMVSDKGWTEEKLDKCMTEKNNDPPWIIKW